MTKKSPKSEFERCLDYCNESQLVGLELEALRQLRHQKRILSRIRVHRIQAGHRPVDSWMDVFGDWDAACQLAWETESFEEFDRDSALLSANQKQYVKTDESASAWFCAEYRSRLELRDIEFDEYDNPMINTWYKLECEDEIQDLVKWEREYNRRGPGWDLI